MLLSTIGAAAGTASGTVSGVRFYVPPPEDPEDWRSVAQTTWTGDELIIEAWPEPGCPPPSEGEESMVCGYLEGSQEARILVLRELDGTERRFPVPSRDLTQEQARADVLLMLQSTVTPMAVTDEGWVPVETADSSTGVPVAGSAPSAPITPDAAGRGSARLAVGLAGRVGLDTPVLVPALRAGIRVGPRYRSRTHLLVSVSGELLGTSWLDPVQATYNGLVVEAGFEVRPGPDRAQVLIRPTVGMRLSWFGTDDPNVSTPPVLVTPTARLALGASIPQGKHRLEPVFFVGPDIVLGQPAFVLRDGSTDHDIGGWTMGGEFGVFFGSKPRR